MKTNQWSVIVIALDAAAMLLFSGNAVLKKPEQPPIPEETVVAVFSAPTQAETEPVLPETTAPTEIPEAVLACAAYAEKMDACAAFIYDAAQEKMIFSSTEGTQQLYPASVTKLFSAWVALSLLEPHKVVTAGEELKLVQPGSSRAYIGSRCRLTVEMLIEAMLIPSGNDAAYVVAAAAGRALLKDEKADAGSAVAAFLAEMNRLAQELGFENTHFANPDGYHAEDHYSCPNDIARMGALALENDVIAKYIRLQQDSVVFASGERIAWYNSNHLLNRQSPYYAPSAVGMKTGYTEQAGHCLLAAFHEGEQTMLVGIFGSASQYQRYADAAALYELCK